ncbi:hypothetical protein D3C73_769150 [compost metagenome]
MDKEMGGSGNVGADGILHAAIRMFFQRGYGKRGSGRECAEAYYIKGGNLRQRQHAGRLYDL